MINSTDYLVITVSCEFIYINWYLWNITIFKKSLYDDNSMASVVMQSYNANHLRWKYLPDGLGTSNSQENFRGLFPPLKLINGLGGQNDKQLSCIRYFMNTGHSLLVNNFNVQGNLLTQGITVSKGVEQLEGHMSRYISTPLVLSLYKS